MIYRALGRTGMKVSEIGLGCEHLQGKDAQTVKNMIDAALEQDVNILDIFMSEPQVRSDIGAALRGRRDKVFIQGHIGAIWKDGQYGRSRNIDECKAAFQDLLDRLETDYIDIGMIHFVDTMEDFEETFSGPVIEYAKELREKGIIRAIGMSSHSPLVAKRAVETGLIEVLMFSLNPAYDILPEETVIDNLFNPESYKDESLRGVNLQRDALYKTCETMGTAITVMKGLGGGALLHVEASPFGIALTPVQCAHYALTRPAVASILVGCIDGGQLSAATAYETATEAERDYSVALSATPKFSLRGKCMYCNHCLPCPSRIDVAQVNKYLDLAQMSTDSPPATVKEHYAALESHASDCIQCGECEERCPFDVPVISKMEQAAAIFGK
ncbi:MAG: aldo/keto reductase [Oscillospiraceae bacterium]